MPTQFRFADPRRLFLACVALALCLPASGFADEADLMLLQYGHQNWAIAELLVERKDLIQADLALAARSPDWQVRTFAEVIRLQGADPLAFARETARIADFLRIYQTAVGTVQAPETGDQNAFLEFGREDRSRLPYPLVKPPRGLPPQRIPWPVLAQAMLAGNYDQQRLASLIFWSEPRVELLGPCWQSNAFRDADAWLLEEGILTLGPAAIPFLREQLRIGTNAHPTPHQGLASRLLAALGDPTCLAEFRKRLRLPTPPTLEYNQEDRQAMLLDDDTLAGMEILAKVQDAEALPLLIARFTDYLINGRDTNSFTAERKSKSSGSDFPDDPTIRTSPGQRYHVDRIAGALACYGPAIVSPLEATLRTWSANPEAGSPGSRTDLAMETTRKLIGWVQATDDGTRRIAALRWNLARQWAPHLLIELRRATGESLIPYVHRRSLIGPGSLIRSGSGIDERQREELCVLATTGDTSLVPIIASWVVTARQRYVTEIAKFEGQRGPGTVDAQLLREQAGAMHSADTATAILEAGDEGLLALIRIGGPEAIAALRTTLTDKPWAALAEAGLLLLEGQRDELTRRVNAEDSRISEAAALVLWVAGSTSAQPGLIAGAARRRGESHRLWLARASELGPLGPVAAAMPATARAELRLGTLCSAIVSEAADPAAAIRMRRVLLNSANHISSMHAWGTGLIVRIGRNLVKSHTATTEPVFGPADRPLLEAECLFGSGAIWRGIAANALAGLGDERSIPVIAASADMGAPGGSNPVVPALEAYGPHAAAQAAMVPKLVPAQADTGLAMTRHRYGTKVLADLGDIRAVEQILEGFKTLAADRNLAGWSDRVWVYLQAADKCTDDRLVEALLAITQERKHEDLARMALLQLGRYPDPRGEALLMQAFSAGKRREGIQRNDTLAIDVTQALLKRWGPSALDRLVALAKTGDARQRGMACLSLAELTQKRPATASYATWPASVPDRDGAADKARELTLPILIAALQDVDPTVQNMAADAMVTFTGGEEEQATEINGKYTVHRPAVVGDRRGIPALTLWLQVGNEPGYRVIDCLAREGDEAVGLALLGPLARGRAWRNTGQGSVLLAIGRLHPPGAVAALERIATEDPVSRDDQFSFIALDGLALHGTARQGRRPSTVCNKAFAATACGLISQIY